MGHESKTSGMSAPVGRPLVTSYIFPTDPAPGSGGTADQVLTIAIEFHGAATVIVLDGPVCAYTVAHLAAKLDEVQALGRHQLIIDTRLVPTMTSAGLTVLLHHEQRSRQNGGALVVRPGAATRRVLDVVGLRRLIEPSADAPVG